MFQEYQFHSNLIHTDPNQSEQFSLYLPNIQKMCHKSEDSINIYVINTDNVQDIIKTYTNQMTHK